MWSLVVDGVKKGSCMLYEGGVMKGRVGKKEGWVN